MQLVIWNYTDPLFSMSLLENSNNNKILMYIYIYIPESAVPEPCRVELQPRLSQDVSEGVPLRPFLHRDTHLYQNLARGGGGGGIYISQKIKKNFRPQIITIKIFWNANLKKEGEWLGGKWEREEVKKGEKETFQYFFPSTSEQNLAKYERNFVKWCLCRENKYFIF